MQISTWVHHLADAMAAGRLTIPNTSPITQSKLRDGAKSLAPEITKLPLFVLQTDALDLLSEALIDHAKSKWPGLPYPNMLLEVSVGGVVDEENGETDLTDRLIIHAIEDGELLHVGIYVTDRDPSEWCIGYGRAEIYPSRPSREFTHIPPKNIAPNFDEHATNAITDAVSILMSFVGLLHTPAIETETHDPSPKLNKARTKRKRAAIPTYTAVTLRLPRRKHGEREVSSQPGRASPHWHWRIGHTRTYQSGLSIEIPPTIVAWDGEGETPPPKYNVVVDVPGNRQK